jgi:ribosome maturation factor RimP
MGTAEAVERAVAPAVQVLGIELIDVEARPGLVRVTIDRPSGLDMDAISQATVAVSGALDDADAVPGGRYELEVSSPGLERRLRRPEHFARAVGNRVALRLRPGLEGERRFEGSLKQADDTAIEVEIEGEPEMRRVGYEDIERCHTVFDWRAALAADSASRHGEQKKPARPSAAERSRAAVAARGGNETSEHEDVTESE